MEVKLDLPEHLGARLVGRKGQRCEFVTQDDVDQVLEDLRERGLTLVGIKGGRVYGRLTHSTVQADPLSNLPKKFEVEEVGTARVRVKTPGGVRSRRKPGSYGNGGPVTWEGEGPHEGGYVVTVMVPREG